MTTHDQRSRASTSRRTAGSDVSAGQMASNGALRRRPRRYGQWAATLSFILVTALAAGWLYQSKGDTVEVLVARSDLDPGAIITAADLGTLSVSGMPDAIPVADADSIIGQRAALGMVEGQVLVRGSITDAPVPAAGQGLASLALPDGRIPAGLEQGDPVVVLAVPAEGGAPRAEDLDDPPVLTDEASVYAIQGSADGATVVTLLLAAASAQRVAAYGAVGQATIVESSIVQDE